MNYRYIYNERILKQITEHIFNTFWTIFLTDDNDYYNIYIVCDHYKKDRLNSLYLQEPKTGVNLEDLDELYLTKILFEFILWHKFYGYKNKSYTFSINSEIDLDFKGANHE